MEPGRNPSLRVMRSPFTPGRLQPRAPACRTPPRRRSRVDVDLNDLNDADEVGSMRVLVVDDHQAFRHALTSALSMVDDIEVAGQAGGGLAACHEAEQLDPDVIIMDLSMPDLSG